jgi:VWFA-related protein
MKLMSCSLAGAVGVGVLVLCSGGVRAEGEPGAPVHRTAPVAPDAPVAPVPVPRTAPDAPDAPVAPAAPAQQPSPRPQFEARADVVLVDVTVVSGNGEPVEGLTAADFQLTVNGQPRDVNTVQFISSRATTSVAEPARLEGVTSNDRESTGRLLLFVVDENYLRVGAARAVLRAAERVMERLLPGDLVGLARLPTGRGGVEFTTDRSRIRRALQGTMGQQPPRPIERVRLSEAAAYERNDQNTWQQVIQRECGGGGVPGSGGGGGFQLEACVQELEAQASAVLNDAASRTRVSISAFEDLTRRLATVNAPVNIVLISEGLFIGRDRNDLSNLARLAAQARVSFFVVQPDESMFDFDTPKVMGSARDDSVASEGLEQLAGYTRGTYAKVATAGVGAFERIGRELSGYYLLSFEPTDADRASKDRRIRVEVKRRGLTVRARSTFALADAKASTETVGPEEQIQNLLRAPLPTPGLALRVASYSVVNAADTRVRVILSAEIGEPATDSVQVPIGLLVIDKDDKIVAQTAQPLTLSPATDRTASPRLMVTSVVLDPGEYTLRLAAVGPGGEAGSVFHTISARLAPIGRETLRVSDLVVTSQLRPDEAPRPVPSGIVYSESATALLELTGEDTARLSAAKVVVHVSETEASPTLVSAPGQALPRSDVQRGFLAGLKLGVLPPGEYVARAVISVPGEPDTEVFRAFRLAPVAAPTDSSPIADRVADDLAPAPLPVAKVVAPVAQFAVDDVLKPDVVRPFLESLLRGHPVSAASADVMRQAREGQYVSPPPDVSLPESDEPALSFVRGLSALQKKQYAQAAAWFQLTLKQASDFLGAAFFLGAVHAASGRDHDAVGAWQMSMIGDSGPAVYPLLVDGLLRIGDGQAALDLIAEAPNAWPSDVARLRRVATAQAMLGQFEPALDTLNGLLARQRDDVDLLFVAIQVLYRRHLARPLDATERKRFDEYAQRYIAAKGPEAALVDTWRKFVSR